MLEDKCIRVIWDEVARRRWTDEDDKTVVGALIHAVISLNGLMYDLEGRVSPVDIDLMKYNRDRYREALRENGIDLHLPSYLQWHSGKSK